MTESWNIAKTARRPRKHRKSYGRRTAAGIAILSLMGLLLVIGLCLKDYMEKMREVLPGETPAKLILAEEPAAHEAPVGFTPGEAAPADDWALQLVNRWNPVPEDYEIELREAPGGEQVDARIYEPLMELLEAAREGNQGSLPGVESGYRTQETQQRLYDEEIAGYLDQGYDWDEARALAEQWVAVPGTSEHQLGLAVDLSGESYDVFLWLRENSYRYGFVWRYQEEKKALTGIEEEVWHYRYVGKEAAAAMYEQGLCLEEYVDRSGEGPLE